MEAVKYRTLKLSTMQTNLWEFIKMKIVPMTKLSLSYGILLRLSLTFPLLLFLPPCVCVCIVSAFIDNVPDDFSQLWISYLKSFDDFIRCLWRLESIRFYLLCPGDFSLKESKMYERQNFNFYYFETKHSLFLDFFWQDSQEELKCFKKIIISSKNCTLAIN